MVTLSKNYTLLVNEIPVDDILNDLTLQGALSVSHRNFIAQQPTRKERARALLEMLPERGHGAYTTLCHVLISKNRYDLVVVLKDPNTEDMEVCFPEHSRFHLGRDLYLIVEPTGITLKHNSMNVRFPLSRWKQFQYYLDDIDEAVHYISHNRYASFQRHLGGNVYVVAESPTETIDIRYHWMSPLDNQRHPTPRGITIDFQQYDKLKDIDSVLPTLIPDINKLLPCEFQHQNVEDAMYCSECNPDGVL